MKLSILIWIVILILSVTVHGLSYGKEKSGSIRFHGPHIIKIEKDRLFVVDGSTMAFTVDTPENEGLVSTRPTVLEFLNEIAASNGPGIYKIADKNGEERKEGMLQEGDRLLLLNDMGNPSKSYTIIFEKAALNGRLISECADLTVGVPTDLVLKFTAGQRSPMATVKLFFPKEIPITMEKTRIDVIGRGEVALNDLERQPIGRVGSKYSYDKVGKAAIKPSMNGTTLILSELDLRPLNGYDLKITVKGVVLPKAKQYSISAAYSTSEPEKLNNIAGPDQTVTINGIKNIADFRRIQNGGKPYHEIENLYTSTSFQWTGKLPTDGIEVMHSLDKGKSWTKLNADFSQNGESCHVEGLKPNTLHAFKLKVKKGPHKGYSNTAYFFSGMKAVEDFGPQWNEDEDHTDKINKAIEQLASWGGGTLLFSKGTYNVRTIHLKSNVWLYVAKEATIKALKGADAPETTWFSDKKYRSGLSPTAIGPYVDPENYLTKQDVGHTYFQNTMFFGERLDNVKIIGNGRISGDGHLVTSDKVMDRAPDNRADKMFTFKLCTNIEIGGIHRKEDLWYDSERDEPYYILQDGSKDFDSQNMLDIDQGGHFVLLATGTDHIRVHNTYFARYNTSNVRDIYDFMACNDVEVTNVYSKVSSDDVVKLGSDCSLGFTRPVSGYKVRNLIGDTNCNLFQIGSETADDIMDVHVDNMYVLGANKAGFSISTNDGAHVKDIHLNCGHTGKIHSRSKMLRTRAPFFISISNRARILGAEAGRYRFDENGKQHDELLITNVNIGIVENVILNGLDISEVYGGSSFKKDRWPVYNGNQSKATPIVAGYKLPDASAIEGGLDFRLPNGEHTGYIRNIVFDDIHILVKGGNSSLDIRNKPPELGVGQYNVKDLQVLPAFGLWARHVKGLTIKNSSFSFEMEDGRYPIYLDDVLEGQISQNRWNKSADLEEGVFLDHSENIHVKGNVYDQSLSEKEN